MSSGSVATRQPRPKTKPKEANVKVTLTTLAAGPSGVARPGTVLDMPSERAEKLIANGNARAHDKERDAKAPHGFTRAPIGQNE